MSYRWHPSGSILKSVNWFARYRGGNGKIVNRSTGTKFRNEAQLIAQSWEIEAARPVYSESDRYRTLAKLSLCSRSPFFAWASAKEDNTYALGDKAIVMAAGLFRLLSVINETHRVRGCRV